MRVPRRLTRTELVGLTRALNRQYTKGAFNDHGLIAQFYVPPAPKDRDMFDWSWVAKVKLYPSGSMRVIADGESVVVDS